MSKVEFFITPEGKIIGFEVKGHTGFDERGKDIVCAAISVLTQTAVIGLGHFLLEKPIVVIRDGYLKCLLPNDISEGELAKAQVILETTFLGLDSIREEYGEHLKVTRRRWS